MSTSRWSWVATVCPHLSTADGLPRMPECIALRWGTSLPRPRSGQKIRLISMCGHTGQPARSRPGVWRVMPAVCAPPNLLHHRPPRHLPQQSTSCASLGFTMTSGRCSPSSGQSLSRHTGRTTVQLTCVRAHLSQPADYTTSPGQSAKPWRPTSVSRSPLDESGPPLLL